MRSVLRLYAYLCAYEQTGVDQAKPVALQYLFQALSRQGIVPSEIQLAKDDRGPGFAIAFYTDGIYIQLKTARSVALRRQAHWKKAIPCVQQQRRSKHLAQRIGVVFALHRRVTYGKRGNMMVEMTFFGQNNAEFTNY